MKIKAIQHHRLYQNGKVLDYDIVDTTLEEGWKIYINGEKYPLQRGKYYELSLTDEGKKEAITRAILEKEK